MLAVRRRPCRSFTGPGFCKGISPEGECVAASANYKLSDPAVHFLVDVGPVSHEVSFQCAWTGPDGKRLGGTGLARATQDDFRERMVMVCSLPIGPLYQGKWTLDIYYEAGPATRAVEEPWITETFWVRP